MQFVCELFMPWYWLLDNWRWKVAVFTGLTRPSSFYTRISCFIVQLVEQSAPAFQRSWVWILLKPAFFQAFFTELLCSIHNCDGLSFIVEASQFLLIMIKFSAFGKNQKAFQVKRTCYMPCFGHNLKMSKNKLHICAYKTVGLQLKFTATTSNASWYCIGCF